MYVKYKSYVKVGSIRSSPWCRAGKRPPAAVLETWLYSVADNGRLLVLCALVDM